jgi:NADPH:quinone reductase-like Zn-dependent oxidoreductase
MKAVLCTAYGPPEVLQLGEVERPVPKNNEVLIKVVATAVTASDTIVRGFKLPRFHPLALMMRLVVGFNRPRSPILGMVLAGDVASTGKDVTRFKAGDAVFGNTFKPPAQIRFGAYAEYICLHEDALITSKPANATYEQAAAVIYGAGMALYYLRKGNIQRCQNVLIYGASGSIGTAAVQLARHFGASVTGVCSTRNLELVTSLGADRVLDYTEEDSATGLERYDLVFDAVGEAKTSALKERSRGSLTSNGQYLSVDDGSPRYSAEDIALIRQLIEAGELRAVIDRRYPLEQIVEAHRYVDGGHKKGSVVITV